MFKIACMPVDSKKFSEVVVLFVNDKKNFFKEGRFFDKENAGIFSVAIKNAVRFTGGKGETLTIPTPQLKGIKNVVITGIGQEEKVTENAYREIGVSLGKVLDHLGEKHATLLHEEGHENANLKPELAAKALVEGVALSTYRFDCYKTKLKSHQKEIFEKLTVVLDAERAFELLIPVIEAGMEGANLSRDLVNLPPNVATPSYMAKEASKLSKLGVEVEVLEEKEMEKLGMNLLLAVGRGAVQKEMRPRLIVMKYAGANRTDKTHCVVGKGVMFDSGGYNLKTGPGMKSMKADMGGAACVIGLIKALAQSKSKVNVIGVCGCVVNMVDGEAYLPSDILTSYDGRTVEIGNTDTEGRLVLADAMSYVVDKENPDSLIDVATLTGACLVALGSSYAGMFTEQDDMAQNLTNSGLATGEKVWRLPLDDSYAVKPKDADLNNDGAAYGGASAAAAFLKNFTGKTPWVHLDIIGLALADKIGGGFDVGGVTGYGTRLLFHYFNGEI